MLPMHELTRANRYPTWRKGWLLLFWLMGCLHSGSTFAGTSLMCVDQGSSGMVDLGVLQPMQTFDLSINALCHVLRPVGTSLTFVQTYTQGTGPTMSVLDIGSRQPVPLAGTGPSRACNPVGCSGTLPINTSAPFAAKITGTADVTPGVHTVYIALISNTIGTPETDTIGVVTARYVIAQPACSLSSAPSLSLPFGTLSSNEFASTQRIAEVSLSCANAINTFALVAPAQETINSKGGISATTLAGLSMAVTWADNGTAVDFGGVRLISLRKGNNVIRLGFRPQLAAGTSPAGRFSSQYTLNLYYL